LKCGDGKPGLFASSRSDGSDFTTGSSCLIDTSTESPTTFIASLDSDAEAKDDDDAAGSISDLTTTASGDDEAEASTEAEVDGESSTIVEAETAAEAEAIVTGGMSENDVAWGASVMDTSPVTSVMVIADDGTGA
jgi:hypothetical protein